MTLETHCGQWIGARDNQEDAVGVSLLGSGGDGAVLLVVCDGMGGHAAGEIASRAALEAFIEAVRGSGCALAEDRLYGGLEAAVEVLAAMAREQPDLVDMGTTLAAVHVHRRDLSWISVGDSPIHLLRRGELSVINDDHSMAPVLDAMAKRGEISEEAARSSANRNALRSALTTDQPPPLVDIGTRRDFLESGDVVLVASDGLQTLSAKEIGAIAARQATWSAAVMVDALLDAVEKRAAAGQDNVSVAVYLHGERRGGFSWRRWLPGRRAANVS